jgi:hypothetical protein
VRHRLYLTPGMFGFGRLASYDYFTHVTRALRQRFADAGVDLETHVADVAPTASIRRRATALAELVASTARGADPSHGPIHLLGHSTGGLDTRLVASPSATLPIAPERMSWLPRLRSVTTMNTPHYGTPMASFFATVSGQRMLYAVSALTFIALSLGAPPLAAASALVVAIGQLDRAVLGMEIKVIERTTEALLRALEPASNREVRDYLDAIMKDQGAIIQLTPEAMDLFLSGVEDRPGVAYQSVCAMAPAPSAGRLVRSLRSPWRALSSALFATLYGISARYDERYPCSGTIPGDAMERRLVEAFGSVPSPRANDGVVPIRSQIWGEIAWLGAGDHLDVLGHFGGRERVGPRGLLRFLGGERRRERGWGGDDPAHVDWLTSGAGFDEVSFRALMDAVAARMLSAARRPASSTGSALPGEN